MNRALPIWICATCIGYLVDGGLRGAVWGLGLATLATSIANWKMLGR